MGICDWFSKWRYDKAYKRGMDALDKSIEGYKEYPRTYVELHTCPPFDGSPADCAFTKNFRCVTREEYWSDYKPSPKPETVESVLNQFIALGHDKPEVVIEGETRQDGSEYWTATIDSAPFSYLDIFYGTKFQLGGSETLETLESQIVKSLKLRLGKILVSETTITY